MPDPARVDQRVFGSAVEDLQDFASSTSRPPPLMLKAAHFRDTIPRTEAFGPLLHVDYDSASEQDQVDRLFGVLR
jgi:hypothetical protein